ncbi:MAG TPA: FeoB-associated Cys-rich membrane protein [Oscillospiraceae bacterium]|nr:FeoB-associated Cys-rich membrane protein [Oscillospiraceae bacterium]
MHFLDYCILAVILLLAFYAIRYSIKHKGKCCGNCSGCPGCAACKAACQGKACERLGTGTKK